jgi:hypothetical protein
LSKSAPNASVSISNPSCYGGTGSIGVSSGTGGSGSGYQSKLNAGGTYANLPQTYSSLSGGDYTIYIKDGSDCVQTYSATITVPSQVTVGTSSITYTTCYNGTNGSVTLNATGGNGSYQYRVNSGSWTSNETFNSLGATSYTFQSRDTAGCESSTITVDMTKSAPSATITQTNVTCNGGSNGSISVSSPQGGNSGVYTVSIDGSNYLSFPTTFSNLSSDLYSIYIKDSQGCVAVYEVGISQPTAQSASITNAVDPTCANPSAGSLTISSTGGVWPKTYRLYEDESAPYTTCGGTLIATYTNVTSGDTSRNVTGLTSGGYCVEVTDANGCVTNSGITVLADEAVYYKYQVINCTNNLVGYMTSPDLLVSAFLGGTKAVKVNNVCLQVDYYVGTTCDQEATHLTDGSYSTVWTSCNDCTGGGGGAQV